MREILQSLQEHKANMDEGKFTGKPLFPIAMAKKMPEKNLMSIMAWLDKSKRTDITKELVDIFYQIISAFVLLPSSRGLEHAIDTVIQELSRLSKDTKDLAKRVGQIRYDVEYMIKDKSSDDYKAAVSNWGERTISYIEKTKKK